MKGEGWKKAALFSLRLLLAAGLLAFLFSGVEWRALQSSLRESFRNWPWLAAGLAWTFAGLYIGSVRWALLLRSEGCTLPFRRIFDIYFIGQFFNAFLLGACGGDVARAWWVVRESHSSRTEMASTVFMDRAVGLLIVIMMGSLLALLRAPLFLDHEATRLPGLLMLGFLVASAGGIFLLFGRHWFERSPWLQRLQISSVAVQLVRRAYDAFYRLSQNPPLLVRLSALSVLNMVFLTLACHALGHSLVLGASVLDTFTFFPIIIVLSAVPLTPGGFGVREGLFVTLFGAVGVEPARAMLLSLLVYGVSLVWSLLGGWFFLASPSHSRPR